jgi:ATP-dependent RNA circularization protein (DNA/RNA ligase family)
VLSAVEAKKLLAAEVVVEEKVDGANIGISLDEKGILQVQNRGQYLAQPFSGQFSRLNAWLTQYQEVLQDELSHSLILFGEWCTARHSLSYDALPDWFLLFDVYDRNSAKFWSTARRNTLAEKMGLKTVKEIKRAHLGIDSLKHLVLRKQSYYRQGAVEGVVVRSEKNGWTERRAKLVHPDFTQTIDEHWRKRPIEWNQLNDFRLVL